MTSASNEEPTGMSCHAFPGVRLYDSMAHTSFYYPTAMVLADITTQRVGVGIGTGKTWARSAWFMQREGKCLSA